MTTATFLSTRSAAAVVKPLRALLFGGVTSMAVASANIALAQNATSADSAASPDTTASGGASQLEEIVVTAEKRSQRLVDVPASISVASGADLNSVPLAGVDEALIAVPGVAVNQSGLGGGTLLTIRGVSAGGALFSGSSTVGYYIDSVPFGLIRSAIVPDQNVYDLNEVDVLRGPQGTLYGASALNGVVRVLTKDADLNDFQLDARVADSGTDGGGNNYRGDTAVNVPIIPGVLAARAVVGYQNDSGWISNPVKTDANDDELRNYRLKIDAQPSPDLHIGLSGWLSRDNYGAPSTAASNDRTTLLIGQPMSSDFDAFGLKVEYALPHVSLSSNTSYLTYENDSTLDISELIGVPFTIVSDLESRVISQELYLRSTDTIPWRWTVGGMYRKATELDDQTNVLEGTGTLAVYSTFQSESYAIFGELTRLFLDDRLEVTVGLRHFHDDESEWGLAELAGSGGGAVTSIPARKNTPRVLLAWHVTPDIMTYASYSQGFRSGIPQPNGLSAKFPALEPDTLYNYEMGSKGALFNGGLAYDLSVYYMDWKDIQQSLTIPGLNGVPTSVLTNRGNASGEGADLSVTVTPIPHLKLTGQISANNLAMDANVISGGVVLFSKGDRPDFSPAVTAGLSGAYDFGLGSTGFRGRLSASASYTSKQSYHLLLTDGAASAFGNSTVLSRASFAIDSSKGWVATVFVDNANNYHGAPLVPPYGIPEIASRVRPLTAGLQLDFHLR